VFRLHARLLTSLFLFGYILFAGCSEPDPWSAGPEPPLRLEESEKTKARYDYTHRLERPVRPKLTPKMTLAIMRSEEDRPVEDVPFGSGSRDVENSTIVTVEINSETTSVPWQANDDKQAQRIDGEMLKHELLASQSFVLVERERILDILREQQFSQSKYVQPGSGQKPGGLLGVGYLVEGSVRTKRGDRSIVYLSLYDVKTGEVVVEAVGEGFDEEIAIRESVLDLVKKCMKL